MKNNTLKKLCLALALCMLLGVVCSLGAIAIMASETESGEEEGPIVIPEFTYPTTSYSILTEYIVPAIKISELFPLTTEVKWENASA